MSLFKQDQRRVFLGLVDFLVEVDFEAGAVEEALGVAEGALLGAEIVDVAGLAVGVGA